MITQLFEPETLVDLSIIYTIFTAIISMALTVIIFIFLIKMYRKMDEIFEINN